MPAHLLGVEPVDEVEDRAEALGVDGHGREALLELLSTLAGRVNGPAS
ncbi:hypothetical protein [Actinomycetospora termitidis]|uniref:Uncharacterized protein n=1 Tax=Actinomycetospora termitidis TaxID=3053470 RepID=A0ABT7MIL4_9PSEU|nr:hypothetical protein [Actinomycetospora sp. Odt1-22]MDL5160523.1 hypothetical protein [Actinomycetospora sp. Odt1-22]